MSLINCRLPLLFLLLPIFFTFYNIPCHSTTFIKHTHTDNNGHSFVKQARNPPPSLTSSGDNNNESPNGERSIKSGGGRGDGRGDKRGGSGPSSPKVGKNKLGFILSVCFGGICLTAFITISVVMGWRYVRNSDGDDFDQDMGVGFGEGWGSGGSGGSEGSGRGIPNDGSSAGGCDGEGTEVVRLQGRLKRREDDRDDRRGRSRSRKSGSKRRGENFEEGSGERWSRSFVDEGSVSSLGMMFYKDMEEGQHGKKANFKGESSRDDIRE